MPPKPAEKTPGPRKRESQPPSRVTLRVVNAALAARGINGVLVKADRYFFFRGAEANSWLDRTVQVARVSDLSVEDWVKAYQELKRKNAEIARVGKAKR